MPHEPDRKGSRSEETEEEYYVFGIRKACTEVVYPHIFENADREVGGVLVGWSADGRLPVIEGAIPAISADEQRSTLTFTQDSWEHIHQVMDEKFPDDQIVGWYHSHPGFGIFLSGHDMFIQENFFSGPSQIALVVDPLAGTEGVFAWVDGKVEQIIDRGTPPPWNPLERGSRPLDLSTEAIEGEGSGPRRNQGGANAKAISILAATVLVGAALGFGGQRLASGDDGARPERSGNSAAGLEVPASE